jgi:hypothetical protein
VAQAPVSRIVIRRPNKTVDVITRRGHHDPHRLSRELAFGGEVMVVRHEMTRVGQPNETVAIHELRK